MTDNWRSTDVIYPGEEDLPSRKFLFGLNNNNFLLFAYWHGGVGKHLHWALIDKSNLNQITSIVTLNNWDYLNALDFYKEIEKVDLFKLDSISSVEDFRIIRGEVINWMDPF